MPATPVTWLNEFFVTNEVNPQDPDIIQLANGNILVSWSSTDDTGAGTSSFSDVVGQIFDPLGNPVGAPIQLNFNYTVDNELNSDLVALPGGGFIVVYQDNDVGGFTDLRLDEYDAAGNVVSSAPSIVEDGATGLPSYRNPHVAAASDTSALIVYEQTNASGTTVVGKFYNSITNTYSAQQSFIGFTFNVTDPDVAVLTNGNYVITATDVTGGDARIAYRIVDGSGTNVLSASFIASTSADGFDDNEASVTALAGGGFVITYTDRDSSDIDVAFSVFNAAGTEIGSGLAGSTGGSLTNINNESVVSGLSDGSFVIILDNDEADTMEATHVSATGSFLGSFTFTGAGTEPSVTDLGDGRFAVTWESFTDGGGVKMEILDTRDFVNPTAVYTPEPNWQVGTVFADVFTTDSDADIVHGHTGDDTITDGGLSEDNQYFGDAGDDTIFAVSSIGGDLWDGGADIDAIDWSQNLSLSHGTVFDLGLGTVTNGVDTEVMVNFEKIIGSSFDDIIIGDGNANTLAGGGGVDSLTGGGGSDTFAVDVFNDQVFESIGGGTDKVVSTTNYTLAAGQEIEVLQLAIGTGTTALNISGNEFANELIGNAGKNTLKGGGANDTMRGGGGDDTYVVTESGDKVFESVGAGLDTIVSTVSFELGAGQEIEVLRLAASTGTAALNIKGNQFDNELTGNSGDNVLTGNGGNDTMIGGKGNDTYVVSDAGDDVVEATGNGNDTVVSTVSYSLDINQHIEILRLNSSTGNTALNLTGNNIGQQVIGNAGANTLNGGNGNDTLTGGDGNDTYYFNTTLSNVSNVDTIVGFSNAVGNNDIIGLKNTIFTLLPAGALSAANFVANAAGTAGDANDFIVYNTTTGGLFYDTNGNGAGGSTQFATLQGAPSLTASDFLIV